MLEEFVPFIGLIVFGNIENLILASQGVVKGANPKKLLILSLICVFLWFLIGTLGTSVAMAYASFIELIGGIAIVLLGLESMIGAFRYNSDNKY